MDPNPFLSSAIDLPLDRKGAQRIAAGLAFEILEDRLGPILQRFAADFPLEDQALLTEAIRDVRMALLERFLDIRSRIDLPSDPREGTRDDPLLPCLREMAALGHSIEVSWLTRRLQLPYRRAERLVSILTAVRSGMGL